MRYKCNCCGWIYNEARGEMDCDIEPGTPFSELPEGFECPECYAGLEQFSKVEE